MGGFKWEVQEGEAAPGVSSSSIDEPHCTRVAGSCRGSGSGLRACSQAGTRPRRVAAGNEPAAVSLPARPDPTLLPQSVRPPAPPQDPSNQAPTAVSRLANVGTLPVPDGVNCDRQPWSQRSTGRSDNTAGSMAPNLTVVSPSKASFDSQMDIKADPSGHSNEADLSGQSPQKMMDRNRKKTRVHI